MDDISDTYVWILNLLDLKMFTLHQYNAPSQQSHFEHFGVQLNVKSGWWWKDKSTQFMRPSQDYLGLLIINSSQLSTLHRNYWGTACCDQWTVPSELSSCIVNVYQSLFFPSIAQTGVCAFWYAKLCKYPPQSGGIAIVYDFLFPVWMCKFTWCTKLPYLL